MVLVQNNLNIALFNFYSSEQAYYLEYLELGNDANVLEQCDDGCSSSEIRLQEEFPFAGYYHQNAYVRQAYCISIMYIMYYLFTPT